MLLIALLSQLTPLSASAFFNEKFEPADGKMYSGAGQSTIAIARMIHTQRIPIVNL